MPPTSVEIARGSETVQSTPGHPWSWPPSDGARGQLGRHRSGDARLEQERWSSRLIGESIDALPLRTEVLGQTKRHGLLFGRLQPYRRGIRGEVPVEIHGHPAAAADPPSRS